MRLKEMSIEELTININSELVSKEQRVGAAFEILDRVDYPKKIKALQKKEGETE